MKTQAAQAAALIRKEIKAAYPGLKFTCTSQNYAGGNSINVGYQDQPRAVHEAIKSMLGKYEYGHFDGMTDMYEHSNCRTDIPQTKYLFVSNNMSDAKREEIYQQLRTGWKDGDKLPATYAEGRAVYFDSHGQYVSDMVWRQFQDSALAA